MQPGYTWLGLSPLTSSRLTALQASFRELVSEAGRAPGPLQHAGVSNQLGVGVRARPVHLECEASPRGCLGTGGCFVSRCELLLLQEDRSPPWVAPSSLWLPGSSWMWLLWRNKCTEPAHVLLFSFSPFKHRCCGIFAESDPNSSPKWGSFSGAYWKCCPGYWGVLETPSWLLIVFE